MPASERGIWEILNTKGAEEFAEYAEKSFECEDREENYSAAFLGLLRDLCGLTISLCSAGRASQLIFGGLLTPPTSSMQPQRWLAIPAAMALAASAFRSATRISMFTMTSPFRIMRPEDMGSR